MIIIITKIKSISFTISVMLSATLRTYHQTACDTDRISLKCPRGTSITIGMVQYEKNNGEIYNLYMVIYYYIIILKIQNIFL